MQIAPLATFRARECEIGRVLRMGDDRGHDDAHVQLGPKEHHVRSESRPVPDEVVTHLLELVFGIKQRFLRMRGDLAGLLRLAVEGQRVFLGVQAVDIVRRIVSAILRPPRHRHASAAEGVHDPLVHAEEPGARILVLLVGHASGPHPRRSPGQVVDGARQFFAFVGPLHRRGPHVAPNTHELVHQRAHRDLVLDHLAQLRLGGDPVAHHAPSDSAHDVALHGVAFASRLLEQKGVDKGPDLAVPAQALGAHAGGVAQHVLNPLGLADRHEAVVVHVGHAHGEAQRQRFDETTDGGERNRVLSHAGPGHLRGHHGFREPQRLRLHVVGLGRHFHAAVAGRLAEMLGGDAQLHLHLVLQLLRLGAVVGERFQVLLGLAPQDKGRDG